MANVPPCKNPNHPQEYDREKGMIILEEKDDHVLFACVPCRDIAKLLSVQYRTLPRGWARAKHINELKGVERAKEVVKGARGRIKYFH